MAAIHGDAPNYPPEITYPFIPKPCTHVSLNAVHGTPHGLLDTGLHTVSLCIYIHFIRPSSLSLQAHLLSERYNSLFQLRILDHILDLQW